MVHEHLKNLEAVPSALATNQWMPHKLLDYLQIWFRQVNWKYLLVPSIPSWKMHQVIYGGFCARKYSPLSVCCRSSSVPFSPLSYATDQIEGFPVCAWGILKISVFDQQGNTYHLLLRLRQFAWDCFSQRLWRAAGTQMSFNIIGNSGGRRVERWSNFDRFCW